MQVAYTPAEIVAIVGAQRTAGTTHQLIRDIASLTSARAGDLSFLGNAKYRPQVAASEASVLLLPLDYSGEPRPDQIFLFVENPSVALAQVCARIAQTLWPKPVPGIHPSAVVATTARIHATAHVGPLCVIEAGVNIGPGSVLQASVFVGRDAHIGEGCWVMPGVVIAAGCSLANRVQLQPGVVIGSDGFGYEFVKGRHEKIPQIGVMVIESDVKISAIIEGWDVELLMTYGRLCAWALARAHARSGDAALIAGYMGSNAAFDDAICEFAVEYSDQNQRDYRAFVKAVREGRIEAQVEENP